MSACLQGFAAECLDFIYVWIFAEIQTFGFLQNLHSPRILKYIIAIFSTQRSEVHRISSCLTIQAENIRGNQVWPEVEEAGAGDAGSGYLREGIDNLNRIDLKYV